MALNNAVDCTRSRLSVPACPVTHRFHPLSGRDFEFVVQRRTWGEDRVYCRDEDGELFSLPAAWTDAERFVLTAGLR